MSNHQQDTFIINRLIILILLLIIFDGVFRKWIAPSLSTPILMVKDVVVIGVYIYIIKKRYWPVEFFAKVWYGLAMILLVLVFLQMEFLRLPVSSSILGWRNYVLLAPLAFIMKNCMEWEDIKRLVKLICLLSVPSAILVFLQYSSPTDAFINRSVGDEESQMVFTVVKGVVRPYGFFSFTNGQTFFSALILSSVLFSFLIPEDEKILSRPQKLICLFAAMVNIVVSGSRSNFAMAFIIFFILICVGFLTFRQRSGFNTVMASFAGGIIVAIIALTFFRDNLEIMQQRQLNASFSEGSFINRALKPFTTIFTTMPSNLPFFGYGIGVGSAYAWQNFGNTMDIYVEGEWIRILCEMGLIIGTTYILARLILTFQVLKTAIFVLRRASNAAPLILLMAVLPTLMMGQMTFNTSDCYFGWFTLGLVMAVNKVFVNAIYPQQT